MKRFRQVPKTATFARTLAVCSCAFLLTVVTTAARAEVLIERLFLPGAAPSSFAVGLPGGVSFCFDPVRCAVSYAWTGGFLDVSPARPGAGKFIYAAKLLGPVVYQESGLAPLRRGDPTRVPAVEFAGYTLRDDAIEFRYLIDGAMVREEIRADPARSGLQRRFRVEAGTDTTWWYAPEGRPPVDLRREPSGALVLKVAFSKENK